MSTTSRSKLGLILGSTAAVGATALLIRQYQKAKAAKSLLPASNVVFVVGAPGTGKGTQCQLMQKNLGGNWTHLSAGDLLREARDSGTGDLADLIRAKMQAGEIVPSSITVKLLENAMTKAYQTTASRQFLIDGFPRSHENLDAWDAAMEAHTIRFVLNFECPEAALYVHTTQHKHTYMHTYMHAYMHTHRNNCNAQRNVYSTVTNRTERMEGIGFNGSFASRRC